MKLVHFSDTHLGFGDLDVVNAEGINQREADFYDVFAEAIEKIVRIRPDFLLHTGDLFHRSNPSNRAITFALSQFKRIDESGIPTILIAGNHSTPRSGRSAPILKIMETFSHIHPIYKERYERVEFDEIVFHAIPHINDQRRIEEALFLCEEGIDPHKKNVMMLHCSVGAHYLMREFGEWVYPREWERLFDRMAYVALGHWHGVGHVPGHQNVWYSGSLERTSSADRRENKGILIVDLDKELKVDFETIPIRPGRYFEIDCRRFEEEIEAMACDSCEGALVEVRLKNLSPLQSIEIPNSLIEAKFPTALSVRIKREFLRSTVSFSDSQKIEALSLEEAFVEHLRRHCHEEGEKDSKRLEKRVRELFAKEEESHGGSL